MKFTCDMQDKISTTFDEKKKDNPIDAHTMGLGIELYGGYDGTDVYRNGKWLCRVEELSRMIEELTMLKDTVKELTGVVV